MQPQSNIQSARRLSDLLPSGPLAIMYVDTLLIAVGFFMLFPLLSVHLIQDLGWSAVAVGTIIAVNSFSQQSFKFISGIVADRIGYKNAILIGIAIRIPGYVLYGVADEPWVFAIAAFTSGLAGSIFHPASYAAYSIMAMDANKSRVFSLREMLSNVGFIIGPIIGLLLFRLGFDWVCFLSAGMFAIALILSMLLLPSMKREGEPVPIKSTFSLLFKDRQFLLFNLSMVGVWSLFSQLYLSVTMKAGSFFADSSGLAYLYTGGAIFMVLFQIPLVQRLQDKFSLFRVMALGSFVLGLGLLAIGMASGWWTLLLGVIVFTSGQMISAPTMNLITSNFAGKKLFATYFGFNGIALAIGGLVGSVGGGYLYDLAKSEPSLWWLPWVTLFVNGLFWAVLLFFNEKKEVSKS